MGVFYCRDNINPLAMIKIMLISSRLQQPPILWGFPVCIPTNPCSQYLTPIESFLRSHWHKLKCIHFIDTISFYVVFNSDLYTICVTIPKSYKHDSFHPPEIHLKFNNLYAHLYNEMREFFIALINLYCWNGDFWSSVFFILKKGKI